MNRIYVVGGANIDIHGLSYQPIRMKDSNVGKVRTSFGGVGRNIAENLAHLGANISFCTLFGDDNYAKDLVEHCKYLGFDLTYSNFAKDLNTSIYLALLDNDRDMLVAINDMEILTHVHFEMLERIIYALDENDILLVDCNLNKEHIEYLLTHAKCAVAVDPISTIKAEKLVDCLGNITYFKPNRMEAECLSGITIDSKDNAIKALDFFLNKGVKETVISLGSEGVLLGTKDCKKLFRFPYVKPVSATGAGDSFMAAYVNARFNEKSCEEAVKEACIASKITILSDKACSLSLSQENINKEKDLYVLQEENLCTSK